MYLKITTKRFLKRRVHQNQLNFRGCNLQNSERDYSLLGQRKYIHARINPNPIANHKPYPNPKITQRERMESFYGRDYRKVGDIRFSAGLE